jgi:hypothetical protein
MRMFSFLEVELIAEHSHHRLAEPRIVFYYQDDWLAHSRSSTTSNTNFP